eukprot:TRINITY_DN22196_c0_g1_i1.p1 TRINITY_DN22196_c0_g1~~TRINITY_DN22196_c0_g1_i1.p1  ORF type:complete len:149 (-),score=20.11 TRINITY_DN22196_c0_g1_i1:200-646(-)
MDQHFSNENIDPRIFLIPEIRNQIFEFLQLDTTFAAASQVNKWWYDGALEAWEQSYRKKGFFSDSYTDVMMQQKDWRWIVRSKKEVSEGHVNKSGPGRKTYKNGIYEGDFQNGKREGYGKMTYKSNNVYIGEWSKDAPNGKGRYWFAK